MNAALLLSTSDSVDVITQAREAGTLKEILHRNEWLINSSLQFVSGQALHAHHTCRLLLIYPTITDEGCNAMRALCSACPQPTPLMYQYPFLLHLVMTIKRTVLRRHPVFI